MRGLAFLAYSSIAPTGSIRIRWSPGCIALREGVRCLLNEKILKCRYKFWIQSNHIRLFQSIYIDIGWQTLYCFSTADCFINDSRYNCWPCSLLFYDEIYGIFYAAWDPFLEIKVLDPPANPH